MPKYQMRLKIDLPGEIWKDVVGYEGIYKVSNLARVCSLDFTQYRNHVSGKVVKVHRNGRLLRQRKNASGYLNTEICKNSICKQFLVHRLVAQAFIPNPENKPYINHKDRNRSNNDVENLEWCTHAENMAHSINLVGGAGQKVTKRLIKQILWMRAGGLSIPYICRLKFLGSNTVRRVCHKQYRYTLDSCVLE